jgi:CopA family copper-resistance protein
MARATLAPRAGMVAPVPALRRRPLATMKDMGMGEMGGMAGMDHGAGHAAPVADCPPEHAAMGHCTPGGGAMTAGMDHSMRDFANAPGLPRTPTVQTVAPMPVDRTGEPPQGLADVGHRVLVYRDLVALDRNPDLRAPSRQLRIHLTGNMERYMWAFDGVKLNEVTAPIPFRQGERVRVTLVNDTMMAHPIHLHGHFFELVTGHGDHAPRKHTINVAPGGTATFDLTADAVGDWAFHCHLLYHMHAGMMQVVTVRPDATAEARA